MIFITGPHAAGKTFFAETLQKEGFDFIDLGPTLRQIWRESSSNLSFGEFISQGESIQGEHFTDNLLAGVVGDRLTQLHEATSSRDLLVIGSRSASGIQYLKDHVPSCNGKNTVVIYIDAPDGELLARYNLREKKNLTIEEFRSILKKDRDLGLDGIQTIADYFLTNVGEPDEFTSKIETLIFDRLGYERHMKPGVERL